MEITAEDARGNVSVAATTTVRVVDWDTLIGEPDGTLTGENGATIDAYSWRFDRGTADAVSLARPGLSFFWGIQVSVNGRNQGGPSRPLVDGKGVRYVLHGSIYSIHALSKRRPRAGFDTATEYGSAARDRSGRELRRSRETRHEMHRQQKKRLTAGQRTTLPLMLNRPSWQPLPPSLAGAAEAVSHDLQKPRPIEISFAWSPPAEDDAEQMCTIRASAADGEGLGGWTFPAWLDGAPLLCVLAEWLQDALSESDAAWAEARPPCPGHAHPARPVEIAGEAWWTCPADGRRLARIGSL